MKFIVTRSNMKGTVTIPGSKSHTIRSIFIASLADGRSLIRAPLLSLDTESAIRVCRALGAEIISGKNQLEVIGFGGQPSTPENVIDVGNSGTTLRLGVSTACLCEGYSLFTGDEQIRSRPMDPLLTALNNLGARVISARGNGKAPLVVKGRVLGGKTELQAVSSQYLSSLLINAPLFEQDTEIILTELYEIPYVDITLWWLDEQGIRYEREGYERFLIPGNQSYHSFEKTIPGDFSSASFFLVLGALSEEGIRLKNLLITDPQGDKRVIEILKYMGAVVKVNHDIITVKAGELKGRKIDMNDIPDALPVMAVAGCLAEGTTQLCNVPQARLKETDRISVMCRELSKMGADITEKENGLVINKSRLKAASLTGYKDHRVVMALAVAGLQVEGETTIDTAESAEVTFPNFFELIGQCQGNIKKLEQ
jgi:3-phosphoshikimate 1-carboxyvinyltransferase